MWGCCLYWVNGSCNYWGACIHKQIEWSIWIFLTSKHQLYILMPSMTCLYVRHYHIKFGFHSFNNLLWLNVYLIFYKKKYKNNKFKSALPINVFTNVFGLPILDILHAPPKHLLWLLCKYQWQILLGLLCLILKFF